MAVEYVNITTVTVNSEISIAMAAHTDTSEGDLLIAYIAKDDNVAIDDSGSPGYEDWNMLFNIIDDSQTCLYVAWKIADAGDAGGTPTTYTWTSDDEDWIGAIITYSGADPDNPIHASGSDFLDSSDTPTAPSVAFTNLTAGSLVFQCFGCDFDDEPRTVPAQLTSRFNIHQATDIGGAGGDRALEGYWKSPTGFNDPDTVWDNEEYAYDDTINAATSTALAGNWSSYLELTHSAISCSSVRYNCGNFSGNVTQISVDVYYSVGWHNIYEGVFANGVWEERAIGSTQTVTAMRVKLYRNVSDGTVAITEVDFWKVETGTDETDTAIFGIPGSNEWTAATVIIEAVGVTAQAISGALTFVGTNIKKTASSFAGVLNFVGSLTNKIKTSISGALTFVGALGTVFSAGELKQALSGALSFVGNITGARTAYSALAGALTFVGAVSRLPKKVLSGALSFIGSLTNKISKGLAGAVTFVGALGGLLTNYISLSGALTFVGDLSNLPKKVLVGAISFIGETAKLTKATIAGVLNFAGAVASGLSEALAGAISFIGENIKKIKKFVGDRTRIGQ